MTKSKCLIKDCERFNQPEFTEFQFFVWHYYNNHTYNEIIKTAKENKIEHPERIRFHILIKKLVRVGAMQ